MPGSIRTRRALNQDGKDASAKYDANDASTHNKSDKTVSLIGRKAGVRRAIKHRTKAAGCNCE
tara:strand:- start:250 stop:438 length:189 start_codon:yes stop_codon:yes gene_type:complete